MAVSLMCHTWCHAWHHLVFQGVFHNLLEKKSCRIDQKMRGIQNGCSVGICTHCVHGFFCTFGANLHAQSMPINIISASELRRKFIKCALSVGSGYFLGSGVGVGGWGQNPIHTTLACFLACFLCSPPVLWRLFLLVVAARGEGQRKRKEPPLLFAQVSGRNKSPTPPTKKNSPPPHTHAVTSQMSVPCFIGGFAQPTRVQCTI